MVMTSLLAAIQFPMRTVQPQTCAQK